LKFDNIKNILSKLFLIPASIDFKKSIKLTKNKETYSQIKSKILSDVNATIVGKDN